jgi:3-phenylpropionate/trans-cinnamate dioxygenase ferredoxin component
MGRYLSAGTVASIQSGQMLAVNLEGHEVLLANVGGAIYAINDICPHMGGKLSKGILKGNVVTCPRHGSQFDVTTGKNIRWMQGSGLLYTIGKQFKSPVDTTKYNTKVEGQQILVEI